MKTNASIFTKSLLAFGVFGVTALVTYGAIASGWVLNSTPYQTRSTTADATLAKLTNGSWAALLDAVVTKVKAKADENTDITKYNTYIDTRLSAIDTLDNQVRAELGSDYTFIFQYIYPRILELKKSTDQSISIIDRVGNVLGINNSESGGVSSMADGPQTQSINGNSNNTSVTRAGWMLVDTNCNVGDIQIWSQTWAWCNSTLWNGIEYTGTSSTLDLWANTIWGRFYTWTNQVSACPAGWRVPSRADFQTTFASLGCQPYNPGYSTSVICPGLGWTGNGNTFPKALKLPLPWYKDTRFSADYLLRWKVTYLATSNLYEGDTKMRRSINIDSGSNKIDEYASPKTTEYSVRCIKDTGVWSSLNDSTWNVYASGSVNSTSNTVNATNPNPTVPAPSNALSASDTIGTTEENPKACLLFNTQYQARDQKLLKINKIYTKAEISTYKNSDSTNLAFDDSTWWATWGSSADSSIVCKVKYPVDAVCGSVAWTLVSYGGISSTTPNTCSVGKYAKTYKYNGGNQFEPYYDYLTENTNTSATILSEVMSTANYVYTCEWLNGWAKKECKTGKIKIEGECGTTYDSIYPSGLSTSPASSNNNSWICKWGIFKWTDSPSLIDGKNYKFQCTGVNWGSTASCDVIGASVPSKIDGKCGVIDGVSDHNIGIGNFSGWDSRGLEFVHAYVWSNYPTSSGDAQLCSIWAYGKDIAWVVKITDNDGTDGVYNWECYGKKSDGTIDSSNKASCSAKKLKLWSCGTLNWTKLAGTETIAAKASTIPGLYTGPYLKGDGKGLILRQYLPSVMNFTSPLLCKDGKTAVISDDYGTSGYYKWKCPGDYSGSGHSFLFNNWKDNNSENCQAERVTAQ